MITGKTLTITDELVAGCSTAGTTLTLKGGGTVDVYTGGNVTRVDAFGTTVSSTLSLTGTVTLKPKNIEIFGGSSGSFVATFAHGSGATVSGSLSGLHMQGYSALTVTPNASYSFGSPVVIDTDGGTTDADITLHTSATISAPSLGITAGASHAATLTILQGTLSLTGTATIGADGATQSATLVFDDNAGTPSLTHVTLKKGGELHLADSYSLTGTGETLTIDVGAGNADIVITGTNESFTADIIVFEKGSVDFSPTLSSGGLLMTQ